MAITQRSGVLGQVQQQGQATIANAQNLLRQLQSGPSFSAPQPRYVSPAPAPQRWDVAPGTGGTGQYQSAPSSASAAQQILAVAQARQQAQPSVLNDVARNAVLTALAVATGQPQRQPQPMVPPLNRMSAEQQMPRFSPERQGQQFDQQIQITKAQASPTGWMDPAYPSRMEAMTRQLATLQNDPMAPIQSPRIQQEQRALSAYPAMDPRYLRTLDEGQLAALLSAGNKPPAAPTAAGTPDYPTVNADQYRVPGQMSKTPTSYAPVDAQQYRMPPVPPAGAMPGMPDQRTGTQQVTDAMGAMLARANQPTQIVQGGQMADDGGGGVLDTLGGVVGDVVDWTTASVGELAGGIRDAASGTFDQFIQSGPVQTALQALEALDWFRSQNVDIAGDRFYAIATGDVGVGDVLSGGPVLAAEIGFLMPIFEADPESKTVVINAYENGYSSPSHIAQLEAVGVDPSTAPPQFTGGRAVWEALIGYATDDKPGVVKYPIRALLDTIYDPLTAAGAVGKVGTGTRALGNELRTLAGAGTGTKVAGGVLEGIGRTGEIIARAPDAPVEAIGTVIRKGTKKTGEVTGLFSPSTGGARAEAAASGADLEDALNIGRAGVPEAAAAPDVGVRVAFDAEAQGVTPTSGPRLISEAAPPASTAAPPVSTVTPPTSGAAPSGGSATPSAGSAAPPPQVDTVLSPSGTRVPTFDSLPNAPRSTADNPSKVYNYNGQQIIIRTATAADGATYYSAQLPKATGVRDAITADSYVELMDLLPERLGGKHPTISGVDAPVGAAARRTTTGPTLADVNTQIANLKSGAYPSMTARESAAEMLRLRTLRNDMRAGRVPSDGSAPASATPPITRAERDAAAAAGSTPTNPRSTGANETVRAAETAKTEKPTKRPPMTAAQRKANPSLAKAVDRNRRMAKEDAAGLPKEVNKILGAQKPGEHEFSPVYGGHRPLDKIVTKAIDSKDPEAMKRANAFVKAVDESVEQHLRPDEFYRTWNKGGAPIFLQRDPRLTDDFFEAMRVLDPDADQFRLKVLANGLAKGVLDDIAELQYQLGHLFPMILKEYPEEFTLEGALGSVGRVEGKNFRAESAEWLIREYLDTPVAEVSETILVDFLTGQTELPIIADGVHIPYAHAIPGDYHAESIARLREMREQWTTIKRDPAVADEIPDWRFREADVAAQFDGGLKGGSKGIATSVRGAKHQLPTEENVLTAIGEINDPELSKILLEGDARAKDDLIRKLDQPMPAGWTPPGYTGPKTEWNVKEALDAVREEAARTPSFDHRRAVESIGELAAGLQPKMTPAQLKAARAAAKAKGLDPALVKDGTSLGERLAATRGIRALDWFMRQYRALRLFNPIIGTPNRLGDVAGNAATLAGPGASPWLAAKSIPLTFTETKAYRSLARDTRKLTAEWAKESPVLAGTGQAVPERLLRHSKLNDAGLTDDLPPLQGWLDKHNAPRGVKWLSNAWTAPYYKDMMVASENTGRLLTFEKVYADAVLREAVPALRNELGDQADAMLAQIGEVARSKANKKYEGWFSPGDVIEATGSEDLGRKWQRALNAASEKGQNEADRLFFSSAMTNADEIARRTFTFHFWMARASVLYGRWLLRNPVLLSGFYKMHQEAAQISEEQGLPGWLSGMLKFYSIAGNGSGYAAMDPIGMLFPTFFMDAYSQEGNKFQALQNLLIPMWGGALGSVGLTQNVPNVTGTKGIERFIIDMGNYLKGEGIPLESIPGFGQFINQDSLQLTIPTEEFTRWGMEQANNLLTKAGVTFGDFTPFDRQANEEDQLYSIGQEIAISLYGPDMTQWTEAQVAELTAAVHQAQYGDGEETWLSETIRAEFGREGAARAGMSLFIPGGVVTRQEFRDDQMAQSSAYWNDFFAGKTTTKEGESAATGRQMATSANPVWVTLNTEYYKIGTEDEQQQYTLFNNMRYSPEELNPNATIVINNGNGVYTFYSMSQLANMSEDDRKTVLSVWMADNPNVQTAYEKVKSGRDQFEVDHPDFGQYTSYRAGVYGYTGGPTQFRKDMADNPTFMAAMEEERKKLKGEGKSGAVLEAELDQWATSQQAFHAATGQPYKRDDRIEGTPGPSSVAAMFSLREEPESGGGSSAPKEEKDPSVDDYWGPVKGTERLATDQAQYDYDNAEMERRFGPAWNQATAEWEDHADSAKEREELGYGDKTYQLPSASETMRRYEIWEEDNPGGSPEEFFAEMLQTEGFGVKVPGSATTAASTLPGGTVYSGNQAAVAYPKTPMGRAQAGLQQLRGVQGEPVAKPTTASPKTNSKVTMTGGTAFPLSQEYGMTSFASSQVGPGGMYDYTSGYTSDGSHVGHMGVDIKTPIGTPLYAPVSGTVVQAGGVDWEQDDRYGNQPGTGGLRIELPNGDIVVMGHMQQISVNVGDTVQEGQPVGYSGTAGADPRDPGAGAHVHVEYRQYAPGQTRDGYLAVDPRTKLNLGV